MAKVVKNIEIAKIYHPKSERVKIYDKNTAAGNKVCDKNKNS